MIVASTRSAGMRNYRFATATLREGGFMRLFVQIAALGCFALAILVVLVQFHPDGPNEALGRVAHAAVLVSAVAVGARWGWGPWPSYRQAVIFAVWLDASIAALALTMATPAARLCVAMLMGVNGVFIAFLLGWQTQVMHLVVCGSVIAMIVADAALGAGADLAAVFLVSAPAFTWVLAVPLCGCMLIEYGRATARKTVRSAHYDPLTGLRNRRGMYAAINNILNRSDATPVTVVAAVCDIDRFKQLNDREGHATGDRALVEWAKQLRSLASGSDITARIGGDELVLVTVEAAATPDAVVAELLTKLGPLTHAHSAAVAPMTASVGIAAHSTADPHFNVDDVLRHADAAMYDAKRGGGATCAVYRAAPTPRIHAGTVHRFRAADRV